MVTFVWRCLECQQPIHLTVPTEPAEPGRVRVLLTPALHVHYRQHRA